MRSQLSAFEEGVRDRVAGLGQLINGSMDFMAGMRDTVTKGVDESDDGTTSPTPADAASAHPTHLRVTVLSSV